MPAQDSSDEDIFTRGGGVRNNVSIYDELKRGNFERDSDDSDEGTETLRERAQRRKPGKSAKRRRPNGNEDGAKKKKKEDAARAREMTSVFDSDGSSNDEVEMVPESGVRVQAFDVDADEEVPSMALIDDDEDDAAVRRVLERTRRIAAALTDESRINLEAELEVRKHLELEARVREAREAEARAKKNAEEALTRAQPAGRPIVLKVRCGTTMEKRMRIKTTSPLLMVVKPFCKEFGIDDRNVYMQIDGENVEEGQTPEDFELEDNFVIDLLTR